MAIGAARKQVEVDDAAVALGERLEPGTLYRLLADHGHRLFSDDYFADLFAATSRGRPTVPARVVAVVMLLQAFEGLSDREALDRLGFDLRWRAGAGLGVVGPAFHPTVLVGLRSRLRASDRPRRLFEDVTGVARAAGLLRGRTRVLDSTPLLDAVATQDTVTQLRAAIRAVLRSLAAAGAGELAVAVRAALRRDDDYATVGKPACDWDDPAAREQLVDALVRDAQAALAVLDGVVLPTPAVREAVELLALVAGQDVAAGADGVFRLVRGVARDRVLSTVDPQARHGHKSRARRFDGYQAHLAVDPDDELITAVAVTAANAADRDVVEELLAEPTPTPTPEPTPVSDPPTGQRPALQVVGDSAYADGATLSRLTAAGHSVLAKVPPARNATGGFPKDAFAVDLDAATVTCPAGQVAPIRPRAGGAGAAAFGEHCPSCPLRARCTNAAAGRVVGVHPHEAALQAAKSAQRSADWQAAYRSTRPTVERKISHFTRRGHGGRKARCRGLARIATDVLSRGSALNLARLAVRGLHWSPTGWAVG